MGEAILTTRPSSGGSNSGGSEAIGDIITTYRTDPGDNYLLCNGVYINSNDYPELSKLLPELYSVSLNRTVCADIKTGKIYTYIYNSSTRIITISGYNSILDCIYDTPYTSFTYNITSSSYPTIFYVYNNNITLGYSGLYYYSFKTDGTLNGTYSFSGNIPYAIYQTDDYLYTAAYQNSNSYRFYVSRSSDGISFNSYYINTNKGVSSMDGYLYTIDQDIYVSFKDSGYYSQGYRIPLSTFTDTSTWEKLPYPPTKYMINIGSEYICICENNIIMKYINNSWSQISIGGIGFANWLFEHNEYIYFNNASSSSDTNIYKVPKSNISTIAIICDETEANMIRSYNPSEKHQRIEVNSGIVHNYNCPYIYPTNPKLIQVPTISSTTGVVYIRAK